MLNKGAETGSRGTSSTDIEVVKDSIECFRQFVREAYSPLTAHDGASDRVLAQVQQSWDSLIGDVTNLLKSRPESRTKDPLNSLSFHIDPDFRLHMQSIKDGTLAVSDHGNGFIRLAKRVELLINMWADQLPKSSGVVRESGPTPRLVLPAITESISKAEGSSAETETASQRKVRDSILQGHFTDAANELGDRRPNDPVFQKSLEFTRYLIQRAEANFLNYGPERVGYGSNEHSLTVQIRTSLLELNRKARQASINRSEDMPLLSEGRAPQGEGAKELVKLINRGYFKEAIDQLRARLSNDPEAGKAIAAVSKAIVSAEDLEIAGLASQAVQIKTVIWNTLYDLNQNVR